MRPVSNLQLEAVGNGKNHFKSVSNGSAGKEMEAVPYTNIGAVSVSNAQGARAPR